MTRIDENRPVQQVSQERSANKPKGDAAKFNKAMESKQQQQHSMVKNDSSPKQLAQPERHASPSSMMSKSGIANPFASKLAAANKQFDMKSQKMATSDKTADLDTQRTNFEDSSNKQLKSRLDKQERASDTYFAEHNGVGGNVQGQATAERAKNEGLKDLSGNAAGAQVMGSGAAGTKAAEGPAAAHTVEIPQQVLDKLVDKVQSGVTAEGLSTFQIELKDDVLKGASISVTANGGKISVKVDTKDANIRRLFQASEGQLARAFDHKGLSLESLVISQHQ